MKKVLILLALSLICGGAASAQTARQLYLGYANNDKIEETPKPGGKKPSKVTGKPGAKVIIERSRNGKLSFVSPTSKFRSGDKIRLRFATNFDGYIAILNVGSTGTASLLFPYKDADAQIQPSDDFQVPQKDWIVFDDNPGTENLTILMSRQPLGLDADNLQTIQKSAANTRDLYIESGSDATYAVCSAAALEKPIGFTLKLKHGK